jgi:tetratricopeptide (TPR) repeat protein
MSLVLVVYGQTLRFGFLNFDDNTNVYETPQIVAGISLPGIAWAFTHAQVGRWAPITAISRQLDCQLYGLWAGGHHLTNLLLHASISVLLFLVLLELAGSLWRSGFVAALFALHPLRVEAVAWVSARGELLCALFAMLSLWSYATYAHKAGSRFHYAMSLFWFSAALMSKSTVVTLPFVLLLLDYWPLARLRQKSQLPRLLLEKLPFLALSAASCAASVIANQGAVSKHQNNPLLMRIGNALVTYVVYLGKTIYPVHLAALYPFMTHGWPVWQVAAAALLLASLTWGAFALVKSRPFLLIGWLWYLGMLVPMAGVLQAGDQAYADRYTYLPQIGLWIAGTWSVAAWTPQWRHRGPVLAGAAAAILGILLVCSYRQTGYWRDSESLWRHTLDCTVDNYTAHNNLGNALLDQGREGEATAQYQEAVRINPSDPDALANLAHLLLKQGHPAEAMASYGQALRINPASAPIHEHFGMDLYRLGRVGEAAGEFRKALQIDPDFADAHICLGNILLIQGRPDDGIAEYLAALRINPANALAARSLDGVLIALFQHSQVEDAISRARQALGLFPANPGFQNALAWMLATAPQAALRNGAEALDLAAKASRSTGGGDPGVLRTLAAAYAETGDFSNAAETAQSALQLAQAHSDRDLAGALRREIQLYQGGRAFPERP